MNIISIQTPEDLGQKFEPLAKEWTSNGEFWSVASCKETMLSVSAFISAAVELDQKWCGWYLATKQGDDYELLFIYSTPGVRGRGIGKLLLSDLIKKVREDDNETKIFLEVRAGNNVAIRLYESLGFVKNSTRARYYSNGEDAFVYQLALNYK